MLTFEKANEYTELGEKHGYTKLGTTKFEYTK